MPMATIHLPATALAHARVSTLPSLPPTSTPLSPSTYRPLDIVLLIWLAPYQYLYLSSLPLPYTA